MYSAYNLNKCTALMHSFPNLKLVSCSMSLPSGSFHKPLILIHQCADRMKITVIETNQTDEMDHSLAISMKLWAMLCWATRDGWVIVEISDKMWREWQITSAFLPWEPYEQCSPLLCLSVFSFNNFILKKCWIIHYQYWNWSFMHSKWFLLLTNSLKLQWKLKLLAKQKAVGRIIRKKKEKNY